MDTNFFDEKDEKAIVIKRKLSAFSDFLDNGLPFIEKNYPNEVAFVLENKDKPFAEVAKMLDKELEQL
ncbi:MAG: hypothetical protein ABI666_09980 [Ferruginibacter sp.]